MSKSVITYVEVPLDVFPEGAELVPKIMRLPGIKIGQASFRVVITTKVKRYVLPMDGTEDTDDTESTRYTSYAYRLPTGVWTTDYYKTDAVAAEDGAYVAQADIDAAPAWVKAIKPVEVKDNEQ